MAIPAKSAHKKNSSQEIPSLTAGITKNNPVGPSMRYSTLFDEIQSARRQDDPSLPQGVWQRDCKQANWETVASLCQDYISNHSKDLQILAWLTEAWIHTKGLIGLVEGLKIITELCTAYGETIHPCSEDKEETLDNRINIIAWLNQKLPYSLFTLPISQPSNDKISAITYADYVISQEPSSKPNSNIKESQKNTSKEFYEELARISKEALETIAMSETALESILGKNTVTLRDILKTVQGFHSFAERALALKKTLTQPAPKDSKKLTPLSGTPPTKTKPPYPKDNPLKDNAVPQQLKNNSTEKSLTQIYEELQSIAQELSKCKPQSPAPYLIKKAIAWDKLSFQEWLADMSQNGFDVQTLQKWLEILPPKIQK